MENNNTTLTVQGKEQKKNPVSRFFSAVNAKRKKIMLTLTTMVTMSMMSTATAFAAPANSGGGGGGTVDGEAAFNEVIGFFADLSAALCSLSLSRTMTRKRKQEV